MLVIEDLVKTFNTDKGGRLRGAARTRDRARAKGTGAKGSGAKGTGANGTGANGTGANANGAAARVRAVDGVSIEVREGELFSFLGPSGCGKTTTLRSVAGLERPDSGEIRVGDTTLFSKGKGRSLNIPVNRRGLGMVFQSYAIWPHMKVFDNVAFPLQVASRNQRPPRNVIRDKVMSVLQVMELADFADRQATKLSGGQQQRLALARALVTEPALLLLDEPLSNLDAKLRESLRFELKRLQQDIGITSIYVTHDQIEALALSSRIAVMKDGQLMQVGTPLEIYQRPANKFVAEFIGTSNFLDGRIVGRAGEQWRLDTPAGPLQVSTGVPVRVGDPVLVAIRPECVTLRAGAPTGREPNEWAGEVVTRGFLGDSVDFVVRVADEELRVRSNPTVIFDAHDEVTAVVDPERVSLVPMS